MKIKRVKYVVEPSYEDIDCTKEQLINAYHYLDSINIPSGRIIKPTLKSAERFAQKCANATGTPFLFYVLSRRVIKTKMCTRMYIVAPIESECFLEKL